MSSPFAPPLDKPGFDLHADQRGRLIGSCTVILVITDVFVFLRLLSRKLARAGYWWDDVFAVLAMLFSNVLGIIVFCELRYGFGRHIYIWPMPVAIQKEKSWLKGLFVFEIFFHTATTLSKFSILAFYRRIFPILQFRKILIWTAVLCVVYMVAIDLAILLQCRPLHYVWDRADESIKGKCFNVDKFFKGSGGANVVLNFLVFVLPIPLLWRLRVTVKQQIVLTAIFTLAGFVVLVSIIWIVVLSNLEAMDVTWGYINALIWSTLEPNMAVVCACIPSLRPLFTIISNGVFQHPLVRGTIKSARTGGTSSSKLSSKLKWGGGSKVSASEGRFSNLDEPEDLRPLGHGVSVRGGRTVSGEQADGGGMELEIPQTGIGVKTDVEITTSERLVYNDRLY